ncbi:hypothetical protein [Photobacterium leiognathi]|uniref:hypothetical protein n=1 Tax=Photobacterium leiognathi TaxID=553611 RepID=UPI002980F9CC|nr:hypothetical protein [Photobacterium leiognathi]
MSASLRSKVKQQSHQQENNEWCNSMLRVLKRSECIVEKFNTANWAYAQKLLECAAFNIPMAMIDQLGHELIPDCAKEAKESAIDGINLAITNFGYICDPSYTLSVNDFLIHYHCSRFDFNDVAKTDNLIEVDYTDEENYNQLPFVVSGMDNPVLIIIELRDSVPVIKGTTDSKRKYGLLVHEDLGKELLLFLSAKLMNKWY